MATRLTASDSRQSLNAHAAAKGAEIRAKYGPDIGWEKLLQILGDRSCVRYSCEIVFNAAPLKPEEFAVPLPKGYARGRFPRCSSIRGSKRSGSACPAWSSTSWSR